MISVSYLCIDLGLLLLHHQKFLELAVSARFGSFEIGHFNWFSRVLMGSQWAEDTKCRIRCEIIEFVTKCQMIRSAGRRTLCQKRQIKSNWCDVSHKWIHWIPIGIERSSTSMHICWYWTFFSFHFSRSIPLWISVQKYQSATHHQRVALRAMKSTTSASSIFRRSKAQRIHLATQRKVQRSSSPCLKKSMSCHLIAKICCCDYWNTDRRHGSVRSLAFNESPCSRDSILTMLRSER